MKKLSTASLIALHLDQVISLFDFIDGVKSIGEFVKRTELLASELFVNKFADDKDNPSYKFKGDMLEILADVFFNVYSSDTKVGLISYASVPISEDFGVDGIGTNVNGDLVAVQCKYKANPLIKIEYSEVSKTYCAAKEVHNIPLNNNNTIFVFTTGNEMTQALEKVLKNKVRLIDRKIISDYIDDNQNFWQQAEQLILFTLNNM